MKNRKKDLLRDESVRQAFAGIERTETARFAALPDGEPTFSPGFEERMDALLSRGKEPRRAAPVCRRVIAAGVAAALLLVFLVVPVSAGGKTAASFLLDVLEKHTFFTAKPNGQNVPTTIETFYTVDPPEGYTNTKKELFVLEDMILLVGLTWKRGSDSMSFSQSLIGGGDTMDSEDAYHEVVDWNGYDVYYYYKWGQSYALWLTEEYKLFLIADNTDKEAFFAIMDTLRELTPEELETFERL